MLPPHATATNPVTAHTNAEAVNKIFFIIFLLSEAKIPNTLSSLLLYFILSHSVK